LKEIHESHLASLYESLSEENQLFKDVVCLNKIFEDSWKVLIELRAEKDNEGEIKKIEENLIYC